MLQKWIEIIALVLRILLWPLRRATQILFPPGEFEGLSPAVTEKAAQQFVSHLRAHCTSPQQLHAVSEAFSAVGFSALKHEAVSTRSLIVIYLHSPLHRQAKEMCQKLIQPPILEFLKQDHVKAMGASIHTSQGAQLAQLLGAVGFPMMCMLQPAGTGGNSHSRSSSGGMQLIFKAEGPAFLSLQPAQLLSILNTTYSRHEVVLAEQEARRIEREEEAELRRQQDAEYQEALRADQERERQRQEEREREQRRIQEEEEKERRKAQEEEERLAKAMSLQREEPTSGGTRIRFVLPNGKKLDRRFDNDETIGALKAFLILHFADEDPNIKNIALSTNFPKMTYDRDDQTLQESGLCPQSVLMVQDLDA